MKNDSLRESILRMVEEFAQQTLLPAKFVPGVTPIPASGKFIGASELRTAVDAVLDGWFTTGRFNDEFERRLGEWIGGVSTLTVNSGSSANLVALSTLCSPKLKNRRLVPGDEVITCAVGFPTTVNPCFSNGLIPVLVDAQPKTYNIDCNQIESAITDRTRAIMIAHTLGNPFDIDAITAITKKHNLYLVEDCCDALGSTYNGKAVGTFGDLATLSFYPAHHVTMGEGGAVFTARPLLRKIAESIRDWGRDCHCGPGADNTCGKRFGWAFDDLPFGYDHKYVYSHKGYNLKITDMQAAIGVAQLDRLDGFVHQRRVNFDRLRSLLDGVQDFIELPEATVGANPSWFGFPITIRDPERNSRRDLQIYLDEYKIGTRLLFGGNLTRQPYFKEQPHRIVGKLEFADNVMRNSLWFGVHPSLTDEHLNFVSDRLHAFFMKR